eukprot:CAMPEP_0184479256 /NCGR_PEP_ID=MMETSP0113_2-20130426/1052_1 /TAXON_ID=91329 /ORGANISM="Norrisiella sphaerica, Strain BC52" /LENGTH=149 /DNA_ID=CAMNT_0026857295 /DNA_START=72 /DNA_END=521 /DNA_ORIENTATION=+
MALNIPNLYRHVLRSIKLVPVEAERKAYMMEAMDSFRKNKGLDNKDDIDNAIGKVISKLSFLHIKHPKTKEACPKDLPPGLELAASRPTGDGTHRTYYRNGKKFEGSVGSTNKAKNYTGALDPDDIKRHHQLIERQHFGGPFWKDKFRR